MSDVFLALDLRGPMQSWGDSSKYDHRATKSEPTKSGMVGLLCAALGIDRRDVAEVRRLEKTIEIEKILSLPTGGSVQMLADYQTVGGGYSRKTHLDHIPVSADRSSRRTAQTKRDYLVDARFGVILRTDPETAERCSRSLADPVWGLWLGRKCCVPTGPIFQGVFEANETAVHHLLGLPVSKGTR